MHPDPRPTDGHTAPPPARSVARPLIVGLALAAAVLPACGGGDERLTKQEFVERANTICAEANAAVEVIADEFWSSLEQIDSDDPASQGAIHIGFAALVDDVSPILEQMAAEIADLEPPQDDEATIDSLVADLRVALAEMNDVTDAAAAGDAEAREHLDGDDDPFDDVNRRAREYGLTVCGEES